MKKLIYAIICLQTVVMSVVSMDPVSYTREEFKSYLSSRPLTESFSVGTYGAAYADRTRNNSRPRESATVTRATLNSFLNSFNGHQEIRPTNYPGVVITPQNIAALRSMNNIIPFLTYFCYPPYNCTGWNEPYFQAVLKKPFKEKSCLLAQILVWCDIL